MKSNTHILRSTYTQYNSIKQGRNRSPIPESNQQQKKNRRNKNNTKRDAMPISENNAHENAQKQWTNRILTESILWRKETKIYFITHAHLKEAAQNIFFDWSQMHQYDISCYSGEKLSLFVQFFFSAQKHHSSPNWNINEISAQTWTKRKGLKHIFNFFLRTLQREGSRWWCHRFVI